MKYRINGLDSAVLQWGLYEIWYKWARFCASEVGFMKCISAVMWDMGELLLSGYSILVTSGMTFDYPIVDLDRKSVTARVLHEGNVVMEVVFDFERDTMQKKGSIEELAHATIVSGMNRVREDVYIRMLKGSAKFYVDNHISDPKQYLQEQRNNGKVD